MVHRSGFFLKVDVRHHSRSLYRELSDQFSCAGKIATETTLLHMEDFKIPEHLGRFAVKAGMWGFVRKMSPYMKTFVQERRARGVSPDASDPAAFGAPAVEGGVAATHTVAEQGGKKKGFGRFVVTLAVAAALLIVAQRRSRRGVRCAARATNRVAR